MNKKEIINQINIHYTDFIEYIGELSQADFEFRYQDKWSAGQQLEHIVMSVKPLVKVYGMPTPMIEQNFGRVERPMRSFEDLLEEYQEKLKQGGKSPAQYVPDKDSTPQKELLIETLKSLVKELNLRVDVFEEAELESLGIRHPLLGQITLKEMLYTAIGHVQHHQTHTMKNLERK